MAATIRSSTGAPMVTSRVVKTHDRGSRSPSTLGHLSRRDRQGQRRCRHRDVRQPCQPSRAREDWTIDRGNNGQRADEHGERELAAKTGLQVPPDADDHGHAGQNREVHQPRAWRARAGREPDRDRRRAPRTAPHQAQSTMGGRRGERGGTAQRRAAAEPDRRYDRTDDAGRRLNGQSCERPAVRIPVRHDRGQVSSRLVRRQTRGRRDSREVQQPAQPADGSAGAKPGP